MSRVLQRLCIVGCGKSKLPHAAPAGELYTGALFRLSMEYARQYCDRTMILSALYGLISPSKKIEPYDVTIADLSPDERYAWARDARNAINRLQARRVTMLVGAPYAIAAPHADFPMAGMQIGERLHWLKDQLSDVEPEREPFEVTDARLRLAYPQLYSQR